MSACSSASGAAPSSEESEVPIACTLQPAAMPERLGDWAVVLEGAHSRVVLPDGAVRVELPGVDIAALARLAAVEQQCCAFFSFTITIDARGTALEVRAPEDARAIVAELFGPA